MGNKEIVKTTTNRGEFNRAYKEYLERKGRIHCSRCGYHRGENYTGNSYGGFETNGHTKLTHPNWKLVSKHPKQWMKKPTRITKSISKRATRWERTYVQIKF